MEQTMAEIGQANLQPAIEPYHDHTKDLDAANGVANLNANTQLAYQSEISGDSPDAVSTRLETQYSELGRSSGINNGADETLIARGGSRYVTDKSPVDFDKIPDSRKQTLNAEAERLIQRHGKEIPLHQGSPEAMPVGGYTEIDYNGFKNILTDLKGNHAYSDNEKAYVWSRIAEQKGTGTLLEGWQGGRYQPSIEGSKPSVRDSDPGRSKDTPGHTVLSFNDSYHGFGGSGDGRGMGYMTSAAANARINGDANASKAIVAAFHAYRDAPEGHRFEQFANTWINGIVAK
jgi:hypothetical protein